MNSSRGNDEYINNGKTTYEDAIKSLLNEYLTKCATSNLDDVKDTEESNEYNELNINNPDIETSFMDINRSVICSAYYSSIIKDKKKSILTDAEQKTEATLFKGIGHIHELYVKLFYDFNETYKSANPENLLAFPAIFEKWKKKIQGKLAKS